MTVLEQIKMEQKIVELEARVKELEEVVQAMGRLMVADQPQAVPQVPQDITLNCAYDCRGYLESIGYNKLNSFLYLSNDKSVRAQIELDPKCTGYTIKFSRV